MFAGGDERGVCYLKTDTLQEPSFKAAIAFDGQTPVYSPYVTPEQSFKSPPNNGGSSAVRMERIDPRVDDRWDRAVAEHPDATIFHASAWAKVLCDTYGHTPNYFRLVEGTKTIALVPMMEVRSAFTGRRGVCLPFSDFCGPLIFGQNSSGSALISHLSGVARERNWKYFELRSTPVVDVPLAPRDTFYGHQIDLAKSSDELFNGFASSVRRAIRKAERSGLSVEITSDASAISRFYRLHSETRRRHGIPPQPLAFFHRIHEHIIKRGLGFVALAQLGNRPIAAAMFFHFGFHGLFKFGASDDSHQELRANNLVMWAGMKNAVQLGLKTLHLGRTDLEHDGLRRFKQSLGTEEETLHYFRFDPSNRSLPQKSHYTSALPGAIFRRLPLTVNRLAGTVLYPHLH